MSQKNIDPTLGALLISAVAALILKIRVKVKKRTPQKDVDVNIDFTKENEVKPQIQEDEKI